MGSSVYQLSDLLQRYRRDVDVMANHLFQDRDLVSERSARLILGIGRIPSDPFQLAPPTVGPRS
jgi:hypothetical protein